MKIIHVFQLLLLGAIWGSSFLFMKLVAPSIGIGLTMSSRVIFAAIFLLLVSLAIKQVPSFKRHGWQFIFLGLFNLVIPTTLIVFSVLQLNTSISAILNATTPLLTIIVARIWLKEKLIPAKIAGLLMGLTGIAIIVGWTPVELNLTTLLAFAASIGAAVCYAISTVFARKKFSGSNPMQTATGQLTGAALTVLPVLFIEYNSSLLAANILIPVIILGIVCTALAFILYFKLIATIGPVNTSLVTIVVPVFSILWGALFLNEQLTWGLLAGLVFITVGLYMVLSPAFALSKPMIFLQKFLQQRSGESLQSVSSGKLKINRTVFFPTNHVEVANCQKK